jgi:hypothetical protein
VTGISLADAQQRKKKRKVKIQKTTEGGREEGLREQLEVRTEEENQIYRTRKN